MWINKTCVQTWLNNNKKIQYGNDFIYNLSVEKKTLISYIKKTLGSYTMLNLPND